MTTNAAVACKRNYIRVPAVRKYSRSETIVRALAGSLLSPLYWLLAGSYRLPGLAFGIDSALLGLHCLLNKNDNITYPEIYRMVFWPIESVRYFEFASTFHFLSEFPFKLYLDVSSPRLFPITQVIQRPEITAHFINPDSRDLGITASILRARGIESRCNIADCLIEDAPFGSAAFDAVTSISVVEHIPQDTNAVLRMWDLLKPGGRLVLSVPCAAIAEEQYVDADHFGLQEPDDNGFFFLQYVYDETLLQERFYSVIGPPTRFAIYGEREPGSLLRGLLKKWSGGKYPKWKEPYLMAKEFRRYQSPSEMPGEGVIVMQFDKR
jgi:SAM-dependent methyltransferase